MIEPSEFALAALALAADTIGRAIYDDERLSVSDGEEARSHIIAALRPYGYRECHECGRVRKTGEGLHLVRVDGRERKEWKCTECIDFFADFGTLLLLMSSQQWRTVP